MNKLQILKSAKEVLNIESKAINDLAKSLDDNFFNAVKNIENLKGKLIISGVGKSGNIASKIAASFTSTGILGQRALQSRDPGRRTLAPHTARWGPLAPLMIIPSRWPVCMTLGI